MGLFYRKRKGPVTFSMSKRGPGMSFRIGAGKGGCLTPLLVVVLTVAALIWLR